MRVSDVAKEPVARKEKILRILCLTLCPWGAILFGDRWVNVFLAERHTQRRILLPLRLPLVTLFYKIDANPIFGSEPEVKGHREWSCGVNCNTLHHLMPRCFSQVCLVPTQCMDRSFVRTHFCPMTHLLLTTKKLLNVAGHSCVMFISCISYVFVCPPSVRPGKSHQAMS